MAGVGALLLSCVGCTAQHEGAANPPSTADVLPSQPAPSSVLQCDGLTDSADASSLVWGGDAVAFVRATISDRSTSGVAGTLLIGVKDSELLAGALPNGPLTSVQVLGGGKESDLPAGDYFLLLGVAPEEKGAYFLSNGLPGSFEHSGSSGYQRCPNREDVYSPLVVTSGVTNESDMIRLFGDELDKKNNSPN